MPLWSLQSKIGLFRTSNHTPAKQP